MKKFYSLLIPLILTLALAGPGAWAAETRGQFKVDGDTITWGGLPGEPASGDTISTGGGYGIYILNGGSYAGADGWNIEIESNGYMNYGMFVMQGFYPDGAYFSGSNLHINVEGLTAEGASVQGIDSIVNLDFSTIFCIGTSNSDSRILSVYEGAFIGTNLSLNLTNIEEKYCDLTGAVASNGGMMSLVSSTLIITSVSGNNAVTGLLATNNGYLTATDMDVQCAGIGAGAESGGTMVLTSSILTVSGDFGEGFVGFGVAGINSAGAGSSISGTNLVVNADGAYSSGAMATIGGTTSLTSSTLNVSGNSSSGLRTMMGGYITGDGLDVTATGNDAHGILVGGISGMGAVYEVNEVTVTNSDFQVDGDLVRFYNGGDNTVTLDDVRASLIGSGNVFHSVLNDVPDYHFVSGTSYNTLNVKNSTLQGNLVATTVVAGDVNISTVNLLNGSTLTGMSSYSGSSTLNVSIDASSQWNISDRSSLTDLTVDGGTIGVTLTGTGYTDAWVTLDNLSLDGTVELLFTGFTYSADILYSFQIFNTDALSGVMGSDYLSLLDWSNLDPGWVLKGEASFTDGVLAFTLTQEVIPEPGTWALMIGGVGVLAYLQRARRRSN